MHFLAPIWLFAVAAMIIPVLIHLWNIREGKTLKVGSISLITLSSRQRSRSLKLIDLPLLLLRVLLLCLLAMVLAMPYLSRQEDDHKTKGWLLMPKENLKETHQRFKVEADSLVKAGYEFHFFNEGLSRTSLTAALTDTTHTAVNQAANYWELLHELDQKAPAAMPVWLFTPNLLSHFKGKRPEVSLNLRWKVFTASDSVNSFIQSAWFLPNKDIRVIEGTSSSAGISYTAKTINPGSKDASAYLINITNGRPEIALRKNERPGSGIDTSTLKIEVFAQKNSADAGYLQAALESVIRFSERKANIRPFNVDFREQKDWLFWLSEQPVDNSVISRFKHVLVYEKGKTQVAETSLSADDRYAVSQGQNTIAVYKTMSATKQIGEPLWHDGFGNAVLELEKKGQTEIYHFYSRFNPAWSDLVWNPAFPKMLLQLLFPPSDVNGEIDRRVIDEKQVQPLIVSERHYAATKSILKTDLTHELWLITALLFGAERWLAHQTNKRKELEIKNG